MYPFSDKDGETKGKDILQKLLQDTGDEYVTAINQYLETVREKKLWKLVSEHPEVLPEEMNRLIEELLTERTEENRKQLHDYMDENGYELEFHRPATFTTSITKESFKIVVKHEIYKG